MRTVVTAAVLTLCLAPAAAAKSEISLSLSSGKPGVGEAVRAVIRAEWADANCRMQLLAVAPSVNMFRALAAFINGGIGIIGPNGPTFRRIQPTPRMGFLVPLKRTGPKTWRATIRFSQAGRWHLVVPNWCAPGYSYEPPLDRVVPVRHRL